MQYKEFLLADLVFEKTNARKYAFDILNHLGMTTGIRDRVSVIKA